MMKNSLKGFMSAKVLVQVRLRCWDAVVEWVYESIHALWDLL